ncbi:glycosyl transferase [Candidatus Methanoperedens nitroreducens]|uniref:Glycosyl transferase n=1 Tax=Candidatus Methanoperedens nitratireducens TaxID=1392998 RepID=A0A062UZD5_9EURY|nr:glycosyltransferase [Candidatus Methanoperedens nitroreducens]KCZ72291.1 glycosyl transferase [Candidatus Methanoperedens nitroreducens]MDJ1420756.1 glycosyltransferase [Candidatus Methanoperedens sp.]
MDNIKVSIVIPTYNRKESLKETLDSLLNQTYPEDRYEIIVCDDGSVDGTEEMMSELIRESPRVIRYLKQENRGPASARNLGISIAAGEIVGFTDDDCTISREWIEKALPYFDCEEVGGVIGYTLPREAYTEKVFEAVHTLQITEDEGSYATCNIFYKKNVLIEVGGFDTTFGMAFCEDTDLGLRIKEKNYRICFGKNVLAYHAIGHRSIVKHLKSLRKYESVVLLHKKHPELKKNLFLGFIHNKKHIYPVLTLLSIVSYAYGSSYMYLFLPAAVLSYSWAHVFINLRIKMYPFRILMVVKHFVPDTVRLYYAIRGSIRYKYLLI